METGLNAGSICIVVSLILILTALSVTVAKAAGRDRLSAPLNIVYLASSAVIFMAVVLLFYYLIASDFRFLYVYGNSSRDLPLPYRIAAFWAGKEGSFLLWLMFLNIFGYTIARKKNEFTDIVLAVLLLTQAFILIVLIVESPFKYIWSAYPESFNPGEFPADGAGLNPLLKDPWMVTHPPVLFLGYASASIPFAYAVAALIKKTYNAWVTDAYPWLLFSMLTLGVGIFLGGYWAYSVLGWGGYWGWDPVENSSLIPWLIAVALVHGFILQRRQGSLVRTNLLLALLYFIMVFYSTWLTRSGALSNFSVHSFSASEVASYLLAFLLIFLAGSAALFSARFRSMHGTTTNAPLLDWKTMTVFGIMVLSIYSLIILTGTSMPFISGICMKHPSSVTETYYNNFSKPFGILILALMTLAATLVLTRKERLLGKGSIIAGAVSIALGIAVNAGFTRSPYAYIFSVLAVFLIAMALIDILKAQSSSIIPSRLTHVGVGLMVLGIITSGFHTTTIQKKLVQGMEVAIGSTGIAFTRFNEGNESSLVFTIRNGVEKKIIEIPYYFDEKTQSIYKEPYIIAGFFHDVYIAPENYESGSDSLTSIVIGKGEEKEISGIRVRFLGFRTEHMTSGEPTTYADLTANGIRLSPGMKFTRNELLYLDQALPGTDRSISLREIDATSKQILLKITPGRTLVIPPDTAYITVTNKRLIWLVWLGTIVIATGGCYAFVRSVRRG